MKQHITPEQLDELTDAQKEKLHFWWIGHQNVGDIYSIYDPKNEETISPHGLGINTCIIDVDVENCPMIRIKNDGVIDLSYPQHENWSCLPRLSIGQMIEFLDEHNMISRIDRDDPWEVQTPLYKNGELYAWNGINKTELCDALWEAVKEVLNDK